jgi:hypothetical protein
MQPGADTHTYMAPRSVQPYQPIAGSMVGRHMHLHPSHSSPAAAFHGCQVQRPRPTPTTSACLPRGQAAVGPAACAVVVCTPQPAPARCCLPSPHRCIGLAPRTPANPCSDNHPGATPLTWAPATGHSRHTAPQLGSGAFQPPATSPPRLLSALQLVQMESSGCSTPLHTPAVWRRHAPSQHRHACRVQHAARCNSSGSPIVLLATGLTPNPPTHACMSPHAGRRGGTPTPCDAHHMGRI